MRSSMSMLNLISGLSLTKESFVNCTGDFVRATFADVEALGASFNSLSIREVYSLILHQNLKDALYQGISLGLSQLQHVVKTWKDSKTLFNAPVMKGSVADLTELIKQEPSTTQNVNMMTIIILLECPLFNYNQQLSIKLALILAGLNRSIKTQLVQALADTYHDQPTYFQRILDLFKRLVCEDYVQMAASSIAYQYRSDLLENVNLKSDHVIASVRVLSLMFNVNELVMFRNKGKLNSLGIVSLQAFYCSGQYTNEAFWYVEMGKPPEIQPLPDTLELKNIYYTYVAMHIAEESSQVLSSYFSLMNYPFLLDLQWKNRLLRLESVSWMSHEFEEAFVLQGLLGQIRKMGSNSDLSSISRAERVFAISSNPYLVLDIRRQFLVEDTFKQLSLKQPDIHKALKIRFQNEDGIDQGGVQKEFFQLILDELFDDNFGLFTYDTETRLCWIKQDSTQYQHFELFGMLLGLAVYNSVMVNVPLPTVFYNKLLNERSSDFSQRLSLNDLLELQPQTTDGLLKLLTWNDDIDGKVQDVFCRTFDIQVGDKVVELIDNGSNIEVTSQNREHFVELYVKYILIDSIKVQFDYIMKGFGCISSGPVRMKTSKTGQPLKLPCVVNLLQPEELQKLIVGTQESYSSGTFTLLKQSARYEQYTKDDKYIADFWDLVLDEFTDEERRKLLLFVTASDRIPLGGLQEVPIVIQRNGTNVERLPTALTCFARLLLPEYTSKEKLRHYLTLAIEESKGFGLI